MWHIWVDKKGPYRVLVDLEGKRSLGTPRYRWEEDNIKVDLIDRNRLGGHELDECD
jgi:hypothetical protein